ncbi:MAG: hypothetical protein Tsb0017_27580 [Geothermobacteraceae bacterium]
MRERDSLYRDHMLDCIERIHRYTGMDLSRFFDSDLVQDLPDLEEALRKA